MKKIVLLFILLFFFPLIPFNVTADPISLYGGNIIGDTVYWENSYASLSVYPHTSHEIIRQTQYANLTWKETNDIIDVAFRFDASLSYGRIQKWNGDSWVKVTMDHTVYNNKHYYYYKGFNVIQDTFYRFKWEYDTIVNTSGKWWMFVKLNEHTIQQSLDNGWYVALDPWWNSDWDYKRKITIDHDYVDSSLSNFPILINISSTISAQCDDGDSVRFVDSTESTEYYYEIDGTFSASSYNFIWVNVTSISSAADTVFYMYYGHSGASDGQSPNNVWDSNYVAVYHLGEASGDALDSTSNDNDGTYNGALPTRETGKIGYCQDFIAASNDFIELPVGCFLSGSDFGTIEAIVRYDDIPSVNNYVWLQYADAENRTYLSTDTSNYFIYGEADDVIQWSVPAGKVVSTGWHFLAKTMHDDDVSLWVDSSEEYTDTTCIMPKGAFSKVRIGANQVASFFDGLIDEFRISDIKRSDAWIDTSFHSTGQTAGFLTFGDKEDIPSLIVSEPYPYNGINRVPISIIELRVTLDSLTDSAISYTIETSPNIGSISESNVADGRKTCTISGLAYSTTYTWYVNATLETTTYSFTTIAKDTFDIGDFKNDAIGWFLGPFEIYVDDLIWPLILIGVIGGVYSMSNSAVATLGAIFLTFAAFGSKKGFVDTTYGPQISMIFSLFAAVLVAVMILGLFLSRKRG